MFSPVEDEDGAKGLQSGTAALAAEGVEPECQGPLGSPEQGREVGAKAVRLTAPAGKVLLVLEFLPPNNRRRDDDNLLAAFKAGRDGLADALGIDDSVFVSQVRLSEELRAGGAVRVTLLPFINGVG